MKKSFQSVLVIMVENREKYLRYTSQPKLSKFSSEPDPQPLIFADCDYDFLIICSTEGIQNEEIRQYRTYQQRWNIKNTGNAVWNNIQLFNRSRNVETIEYEIPNLKPCEKGYITVLFKFLEVEDETKLQVIEWKLQTRDKIIFGKELRIECYVTSWPNVSNIIGMGYSIEQAILALDEFDDDLEVAVDHIVNSER